MWPAMSACLADTKGEDSVGTGQGQLLSQSGSSVLINLYEMQPGLSAVPCIHGNHADRVQSRGLPGQHRWHCHSNWHDVHPGVTDSALLTMVCCDRSAQFRRDPVMSVQTHTHTPDSRVQLLLLTYPCFVSLRLHLCFLLFFLPVNIPHASQVLSCYLLLYSNT